MQIYIIVGICALGVILLSVLIALLLRNRPKNIAVFDKHRRRGMYVSDGVNVDTGQVVSDENYFKGMNGENSQTVLVTGAVPAAAPIVTLCDSLGHSCNVCLTSPLIIGREKGQGRFTVNDSAASREHAVIYAKKMKVYVEDNHSSNHTYLNGKILRGAAECKNGDTIRVGKTNIKITIRWEAAKCQKNTRK